jgi:Uma2 family endonuclease
MPEAQKHVELVAGVLRRMTPTGGAHGSIASRLHRELGQYVLQRNLGELSTAEVGFILR